MSTECFDELHNSTLKLLEYFRYSNDLSYDTISGLSLGIEFANSFKKVLDNNSYYQKEPKHKLFFMNKRVDSLIDACFVIKKINGINSSDKEYFQNCLFLILYQNYPDFIQDIDSDIMLEHGIFYSNSINNLRQSGKNMWTSHEIIQIMKPLSKINESTYNNIVWFTSPIKKLNLQFKKSFPFNNKSFYYIADKDKDFISQSPRKIFETVGNPIVDYHNFIEFFQRNSQSEDRIFSLNFIQNNVLFAPFMNNIQDLNDLEDINQELFELSLHKSLFSVFKNNSLLSSPSSIITDEFIKTIKNKIPFLPIEFKNYLYVLFDIYNSQQIPVNSVLESNKQLTNKLAENCPIGYQEIKTILEEEYLNFLIPSKEYKSGNILKF